MVGRQRLGVGDIDRCAYLPGPARIDQGIGVDDLSPGA